MKGINNNDNGDNAIISSLAPWTGSAMCSMYGIGWICYYFYNGRAEPAGLEEILVDEVGRGCYH